jgi:hypothetical protein
VRLNLVIFNNQQKNSPGSFKPRPLSFYLTAPLRLATLMNDFNSAGRVGLTAFELGPTMLGLDDGYTHRVEVTIAPHGSS